LIDSSGAGITGKQSIISPAPFFKKKWKTIPLLAVGCQDSNQLNFQLGNKKPTFYGDKEILFNGSYIFSRLQYG
jgi:hypothetical protein